MTSKIGRLACLVDPRRKVDGIPAVYRGSKCSLTLSYAMVIKLSFYPIPYASQRFLFLMCTMGFLVVSVIQAGRRPHSLVAVLDRHAKTLRRILSRPFTSSAHYAPRAIAIAL
jgi:hypothetical protein